MQHLSDQERKERIAIRTAQLRMLMPTLAYEHRLELARREDRMLYGDERAERPQGVLKVS